MTGFQVRGFLPQIMDSKVGRSMYDLVSNGFIHAAGDLDVFRLLPRRPERLRRWGKLPGAATMLSNRVPTSNGHGFQGAEVLTIDRASSFYRGP
jgi:hypothetical protein